MKPQSEASKLVAIVQEVENNLKRPISSDDMKSFFKAHPDRDYPLLAQRMGQLLLKLNKMRKSPLIHLVGRIGNRNFYTASLSRESQNAFNHHRNLLRAQEGARWRMDEHVMNLIGTEYEMEARIAAKGFVTEFGGEMKGLSEDLDREVESLKNVASSEPFKIVAPEDLISRSTAREILHRAAAEALGGEQADRIHYRKVLAEWVWPQSWLFNCAISLKYSRSQLQLYCYARWTEEIQMRIEYTSYLSVSRFLKINEFALGGKGRSF